MKDACAGESVYANEDFKQLISMYKDIINKSFKTHKVVNIIVTRLPPIVRRIPKKCRGGDINMIEIELKYEDGTSYYNAIHKNSNGVITSTYKLDLNDVVALLAYAETICFGKASMQI